VLILYARVVWRWGRVLWVCRVPVVSALGRAAARRDAAGARLLFRSWARHLAVGVFLALTFAWAWVVHASARRALLADDWVPEAHSRWLSPNRRSNLREEFKWAGHLGATAAGVVGARLRSGRALSARDNLTDARPALAEADEAVRQIDWLAGAMAGGCRPLSRLDIVRRTVRKRMGGVHPAAGSAPAAPAMAPASQSICRTASSASANAGLASVRLSRRAIERDQNEAEHRQPSSRGTQMAGHEFFGASCCAVGREAIGAVGFRAPVVGQQGATGRCMDDPGPGERERQEKPPLQMASKIGKAVARLRRRGEQQPAPSALTTGTRQTHTRVPIATRRGVQNSTAISIANPRFISADGIAMASPNDQKELLSHSRRPSAIALTRGQKTDYCEHYSKHNAKVAENRRVKTNI